MEWSNDMILRLVQEYELKRELWDNKSDMYRISTAKYEAWHDLASTFDCEVTDIKRKMNSLLASNRRERQKVSQGGISQWFAYSYMKFLHPDSAESILPSSEGEVAEDTPAQANSDSEQNDSEILHEEVHIKREPTPTRQRQQIFVKQPQVLRESSSKYRHSRVAKKKVVLVPMRSKDNRVMESQRSGTRSDQKRRDECDIFGEYIANSLRKHDERTRSMIKHAINNIMFESEMKKYNTPTLYHNQIEINLTDENPLILPEQMSDELDPISDDRTERRRLHNGY